VLSQAGRLARFPRHPSKKGTGFEQPLKPHEHWHIDIAYINIHGTFYYLCAVLDGASRFLVDWSLREAMTEANIEILLEHAKEKFPKRGRVLFPIMVHSLLPRTLGIHSHLRHDPRPSPPIPHRTQWSWKQSLMTECFQSRIAMDRGNRRTDVGHAGDANEFLKVLGNKLWTIIGNNTRPRFGELFLGMLEQDFDVSLRHGFPQTPIDEETAGPIEHRAQIIKRAVDVDVGDVDMPMFMRLQWLFEACALLAWMTWKRASRPA